MTPSAYRRQGREAFDPSIEDRDSFCPYQPTSFAYSKWIEGWEEGRKLYEAGKPRKAFGIELDTDPIGKSVMTDEECQKHIFFMEQLSDEWDDNSTIHKAIRFNERGIRSSQISALVALLIKKGVLK